MSCSDWPHQDSMEHILFKGKMAAKNSFLTFTNPEDLSDLTKLRTKLRLPTSPPKPTTISEEVWSIHTMIATRYIGAASLITMKTPQEGFQRQASQLADVRKGFEDEGVRVYRMSRDQQELFHSRLQSFANFGGHGSGKLCSTIYHNTFIPQGRLR